VSKPPDIRREELLQAASALFLEKGIGDTGIGDITERAEVARGTFYLYFSSKDDVIAELWKRYVAGFMSLADAVLAREGDRDGGRLILELIAHLTRHALDHAHLHRLVYGSADAAALTLCRRSDEAILARLTDAVAAYFRQTGRSEERAGLVASLIFHGLDGALHKAIMQEAPIDRPAFIDEVQLFTANALGISVDRRSEASGE
jgi:AcrR family transcriptional regulator